MMNDKTFLIQNPRQLKDWINNVAKKNNLVANTILQNYMILMNCLWLLLKR